MHYVELWRHLVAIKYDALLNSAHMFNYRQNLQFSSVENCREVIVIIADVNKSGASSESKCFCVHYVKKYAVFILYYIYIHILLLSLFLYMWIKYNLCIYKKNSMFDC